jgi:hypothetical protein
VDVAVKLFEGKSKIWAGTLPFKKLSHVDRSSYKKYSSSLKGKGRLSELFNPAFIFLFSKTIISGGFASFGDMRRENSDDPGLNSIILGHWIQISMI